MARLLRTRRTWLLALALVAATAGLIISLFVFADSGQPAFTATLYSDVIRFEADRVASLRVTIYDLSENELWSSGLIMGDFVDWNRTSDRGERLANGYYMYLAQGWDAAETLVLNKAGRVVLLPGDQVELKTAPSTPFLPDMSAPGFGERLRQPMDVIGGLGDTGIFSQVGIGTTSPGNLLAVSKSVGGGDVAVDVENEASGGDERAYFRIGTDLTGGGTNLPITVYGAAHGTNPALIRSLAYNATEYRIGLGTNEATSNVTIYTDAAERMRIDQFGNVGIGTTSPGNLLAVSKSVGGGDVAVDVENEASGGSERAYFRIGTDLTGGGPNLPITVYGAAHGTNPALIRSLAYNATEYRIGLGTNEATSNVTIYTDGAERMRIDQSGNVGIGTSDATDKLTIEGSSGNLIACYPSSLRTAGAAVFRVEADGDVYADGKVYSDGRIEIPNAADVAERINTSEWVEAGDVVEIDPDHPGFFRKATGPYSRLVAGIISTSPGVILGNDFDSETDKWDDNRPVLAIAGRVPVKASTENGPIAVGDLLVSSSVLGVAMKGDPTDSIGAVVGKAMEPLEGGNGVIMAQVTLR